MSYQAKVINIMIASPSDVTAERIGAQGVIATWNRLHSERLKLVLMPLLWELDAYPATGDRAQALINRQLVERADVLVAVFWSRLGSPTGKDVSGTVEEIREMVAKEKTVMIYVSAMPVLLSSVDPKQYEMLKAFIEEMKPKALVWEYKTHDEFSKLLFEHLTRSIQDDHGDSAPLEDPLGAAGEALGRGGNRTAEPPETTRVRLSDEAATLLLILAEDSTGGQIMVVRTFGGTHIQANSTLVNKLGDGRSEKKWMKAVEDLVSYGLIKDTGYQGEIFDITYEGYQAADQLKSAGFNKIKLESEQAQ